MIPPMRLAKTVAQKLPIHPSPNKHRASIGVDNCQRAKYKRYCLQRLELGHDRVFEFCCFDSCFFILRVLSVYAMFDTSGFFRFLCIIPTR